MVNLQFSAVTLFHITLSILGTVAIYLLFKYLYAKSGRKLYFTPLLVCPIIIALFLIGMHIPYEVYSEGSSYITLLLQPATVAFAVPLYKFRHIMKKYAFQLVTVIFSACMVALATSFGLAMFLGLGRELAFSIAPRSVTTPLAIAASNVIGGNPTITAVLVIATGIIGMIITSLFIQRQKINNSLLKGMLLGITAHGTGTAKAYEDGAKTGVIASLSMIFMGIFTTLIAPAIAHYAAVL